MSTLHFSTQAPAGSDKSFSWVSLHSQSVLSAILYSPVAQGLSHVLPAVVSTSTSPIVGQLQVILSVSLVKCSSHFSIHSAVDFPWGYS